MGFEEGIGFIPFAGIGYEVFKTMTRNDSSPVRAAAAKKLAHDPEPDAGEALVKAAGDKNVSVARCGTGVDCPARGPVARSKNYRGSRG